MLSPGLQAVLFGSTFYPGASVALDFPAQKYRAPGVGNFTGDFASLPGLTVTRVSVGYAATSGGSLVLFPANTARITDQGLLVEEARTNLLLWSQDMSNSAWAKNGSSATANTAAAPDGTTTASTLTASAGAGFHYLNKAATVAYTAAAYTHSVYVKRNNNDWVMIGVNDATLNYFNLATGLWGTIAGGVTAVATALANGWYRLSVTQTMPAASDNAGTLGLANADGGGSFTAAGTEALYIWGQQLELGAFATSYIPTTSASATRAADVISLGSLSIPTGPLSGIARVVQDAAVNTAAQDTYVWDIDGASRLYAYLTTLAATRRFAPGTTGGTAAPVTQAGNLSNLATGSTMAVRYQSGSSAATAQGAAPSTDSGTVTADTKTSVKIGANSGSGQQLDGYLQRLILYPTALSDAQLQGLTT